MRYQDYVIKDGKFIGKFEEMYQDHEDPWHQTVVAEESYSRQDTIHTVRRRGLGNVLEIGCGLGHFTHMLAEACKGTKVTGMDLSPTAIRKAKERYPEIEFICKDIRDVDFSKVGYDGIIFAEILWYVLEFLDDIKSSLQKYVHGGDAGRGILMVNQVFYNGGQRYGTDFFTNQEEMIDYFGWNVLVKTRADMASMPDAYETHTVFGIV